MERREHKLHGLHGKGQHGVSLMEVLIAMLITTIGLLGFAGLQSRALVSTEDTYQRVQATTLAQDMMERMRLSGIRTDDSGHLYFESDASTSQALTTYTDTGNWSGALPAADCEGKTKNCSATDMALYDIAQVRAQVENPAVLPDGSVIVTACGGGKLLCTFVAWGDDTAADCADKGGLSSGLALRQCVVIGGT